MKRWGQRLMPANLPPLSTLSPTSSTPPHCAAPAQSQTTDAGVSAIHLVRVLTVEWHFHLALEGVIHPIGHLACLRGLDGQTWRNRQLLRRLARALEAVAGAPDGTQTARLPPLGGVEPLGVSNRP